LAEQNVITVPLLVGTDGEQKMSKSLGNYVGITDKPEEMYGKLMSIPDRLLLHYFELATDLSKAEIEKVRQELLDGAVNPRDLKMRLARIVVAMFHGDGAAADAEVAFVKIFQKKETPTDVKTVSVGQDKLAIVDLLIETGLAVSKGEARRLLAQKGVRLDGVAATDPAVSVSIGKNGVLIQKGKRFFVKAVK